MKIFEKVTVEKVKAFQWLGGFTHPNIELWLNNYVKGYRTTALNIEEFAKLIKKGYTHNNKAYVRGANTTINIGDWILNDIDGFAHRHTTMSDDEFKKQYKEVVNNG